VIAEVIRWSNNNVMVFDECGAQIVELQGNYKDVKDKIFNALVDAVTNGVQPFSSVKYYHGSWKDKQLIEWNEDW